MHNPFGDYLHEAHCRKCSSSCTRHPRSSIGSVSMVCQQVGGLKPGWATHFFLPKTTTHTNDIRITEFIEFGSPV